MTPSRCGYSLRDVGSLVRYHPATVYLRGGISLAVLAVCAALFIPFPLIAWLMCALLGTAGALLLILAIRAPVEVHDSHLQVGRRIIPWEGVSHIWAPVLHAPLVVPMTLNSEQNYLLVYPGSRESGRKLLHQVRRHARFALIDGLPYRQYWDEDLEAFRDRCLLTDQHWNVLSADDEHEVEALFQKLRADGSLHRQESEGQNS